MPRPVPKLRVPDTDELKALRAERIEALWKRFCKCTKRKYYSKRTLEGKLRTIRHYIFTNGNTLRNWQYNNIFETVLAPKDPRDPDASFIPKPTKQPTSNPPGSLGKIQVLTERLEAGEELWHPDDFSNGD